MDNDTVREWLTIFDEQGFLKLLAIAGFVLPYIGYFLLYKLARYFINKCGTTLKAIDAKLGE